MKRPRSQRRCALIRLVCLPLLLTAARPTRAEPAPARPATAMDPVAAQPTVRPMAVEPAQPHASSKTVVITTNVLSPFFGAYTVDATFRGSRKLGVFANSSYFSIENGDWKTHTGTVGAGVQYYFRGTALRRWYLEGFSELMLSSWRHEPSGNTASLVPGFTVGSVVGYRWLWDFGPVLDLAAGSLLMHFPSARVQTDTGQISSAAFTRVYPGIKINVGWAF